MLAMPDRLLEFSRYHGLLQRQEMIGHASFAALHPLSLRKRQFPAFLSKDRRAFLFFYSNPVGFAELVDDERNAHHDQKADDQKALVKDEAAHVEL
jgi:hypothetical protein